MLRHNLQNPTNLRFERVQTGILSDKKPIIHPSHPVAILHPYLQLRKCVSLEALNLNMFFTSGDVRVYCALKKLTRILMLGMTGRGGKDDILVGGFNPFETY